MSGPVLINGANVTATGPKALVLSLLPHLFRELQDDCVVVVPDDPDYRRVTDGQDVVFSRPAPLLKAAQRAWELYRWIPDLARSRGARVCLTLGDTGPISLRCPHVIFVHHTPLVYDASAYGNIGTAARIKARVKRLLFAASASHASEILVQTPIMKARLNQQYELGRGRVYIVPMAVPDYPTQSASEGSAMGVPAISKPFNLLFLSAYYPHKCHHLLPAIANTIRERGLADEVHIFTTVVGDSRAERHLLSNLASVQDIVTNLGRVTGHTAHRLLAIVDALFLPTLMESYGFPYLETLTYGNGIITSDRDFAHWMCGELATYFEPTDPVAIVDAIELHMRTQNKTSWKIEARKRASAVSSNWAEIAARFADRCAKAGLPFKA